jgi:hypothetical protein
MSALWEGKRRPPRTRRRLNCSSGRGRQGTRGAIRVSNAVDFSSRPPGSMSGTIRSGHTLQAHPSMRETHATCCTRRNAMKVKIFATVALIVLPSLAFAAGAGGAGSGSGGSGNGGASAGAAGSSSGGANGAASAGSGGAGGTAGASSGAGNGNGTGAGAGNSDAAGTGNGGANAMGNSNQVPRQNGEPQKSP